MAGPWEEFSQPQTQSGPWAEFGGDTQAKPEKSSILRRAVADPALSLLKGAVSLPESAVGLADIATGGYAGKAAESAGFRPKEAKSILDDLYSPEQKAANQYVQNADGFVDTIKRGIQTPSVIAHSVGESVPLMLGGAGAARGLISAVPKLSPMAAAAIGEGVVGGGSAAEQLRQGADDGLLNAKQVGSSIASGIGTAAFGALGGKAAGSKIGQRLGLSDVDTVMAGGARTATNAGIAKRVLGGSVSEGALEEMPQSAWEQAVQNYATDKPLGEGVGQAAGMGLLTGGVMGGGFNALPAGKPVPQEVQKDAEGKPLALPSPTYTGTPSDQVLQSEAERQNAVDAAQAQADQLYNERTAFEAKRAELRSGGPMSRAVDTGIDTGATDVRVLGFQAGPPMVTFPDGSTMTRAEYEQQQAEQEQSRLDGMIQPIEATPDQVRQLGYQPGTPLVVFPDGTAMTRAEFNQQSAQQEQDRLSRMVQDAPLNRMMDRAQERATEAAPQQDLASQIANERAGLNKRRADQFAKVRAARAERSQQAVSGDMAQDELIQQPAQEIQNASQSLSQPLPEKAKRPAAEQVASGVDVATPKAEVSNSIDIVGDAWAKAANQANDAPAADLAGEKLTKEWTAFADDSGSLNIPRAEMPQVKAEHRDAMTRFMNARGVQHQSEEVPSDSLKPTQAEFSPAKVKKAIGFDGGDRSILVSSDNYVLDGHHQWLANREQGNPINVIRFDAPISKLIDMAHDFPSSQTASGATKAADQNTIKNEYPSAATGSETKTSSEQEPIKKETAEVSMPALDEIANRLGITVERTKSGFHATEGGRRIAVPEEDKDASGAVSANHILAHELGHAVIMRRGMSFKGMPVREVERYIPNFKEFVEASKRFRPGVWNHDNEKIRAHARKPGEVIADAIASVFIGQNPVSLLDGLMKGTGTTLSDLGLQTAAEANAEFAKKKADQSQPKTGANPEAAQDKAEAVTAETEQSKPESITDFGEKLEGAKKDLWKSYQKAMSDELPEDAKDITLSKHFPEPDYENLIASGLDIRAVASIKAMRDAIPAKPRMSYKVSRWVDQLKTLRTFANDIISGNQNIDHVLAEMRKLRSLSELAERIDLYAELGYPAFKQADGYRISGGWSGDIDPVTQKAGRRDLWGVSDNRGRLSFFDSRQEAVDALRAKLQVEPENTARSIKLDLYKVTSTGDIAIGKKVASNKFIDLMAGFKTAREAREYLKEHEAELLELLEQKKKVQPTRRGINEPRVGKDYRQGEDVTPEKFAAEFGFRGVQFGNYVEQSRRAKDLNNAYDALLDLANTLGIPPRAISLNGSLGLAFGARGSGGVDAASAHYEPDQIVINLTKMNGAGSLGHEWLHAMDNYFSRARGKNDGFLSAMPYERGDGVRPEVVKSFSDLMKAIKKSDFFTRSAKLDQRRSKDYWGTDIELAARAFESYLISKAEANGESNDYLANIVSEEAHQVFNEMQKEFAGKDADPYPYPTKAEQKEINPLFDALFDVIETKETDKGTELYSKAGANQLTGPAITESQLPDLLGKAIGSNKLAKVLIDSGLVQSVNRGADYQGATFKGGNIFLNLDALTESNFDGVALHEGFHSTVKQLVGDEAYGKLMKQLDTMLSMGRGSQWVKDAKAAIPPDTKPENITEEIGAYAIERYINGAKIPNVLQRWAQNFLSTLRTAVIRYLPFGKLKSWAVSNITPQDLSKLAIAGLWAKAEGQLQGQGREAMAFSQRENSGNVRGMADKDTVAGTQAPTSAGDGLKGSDTVLYTGSADPISEIKNRGAYGGLFASASKDAARSHGDVLHEIRLNSSEIMSQSAIEGISDETLLKAAHWVSKDDAERLRELVVDDAKAKDADAAMLRVDDAAEASIEGQRLRGVIAKSLGFKAVEMSDEHGTSYLVLPGASIKKHSPHEPSASAGSDADIRYSRASIVGDSGRPYDTVQRDFFKNVGRDINPQSRIDKTLDYLKNDFFKKMAVGIVDQFRGLRDLNDNGQAYMLARLSKGTAGAFDALLRHGKLSLKDGVYDADTSGGFVERLGVPLKGELDDVLWWIAANRAEGLASQGKENLFTPQDIAAGKSLAKGQTEFDYTIQTGPAKGTVTRNRTAIYADANRVFNEFQKNTLDMAEQSGLIDGASRKFWESDFYVPFYRVSEEDGEFIGAKMGNALVRQQAFKKLKGGTDKLNSDLLSNTLLNWSHLIEASAKNRAAKASLVAAEKVGAAHKALPSEKKTVWYMDGGQKVEYGVDDPFVMTAITSLEYAGMRNGIMDVLTKFKHYLTVGVTASPAFKVRNLIRDSIQAIGTSDLSYNPVKNVVEGFKQTKRDSQEYVSALASGGLIRFGTMLEGSESSRVRQLIRSGVKDSTILNSEHKWQAFYDQYLEPGISAYNELGNRSEEINRAALYNQLIKQGKSHAEAALMARDLMDFSMQGSFNTIRFLSQTVPFFNARLVGAYKLGRSFNDNPQKMAVVTGAAALASIALMLAYGDDDDWKRREDWDRDSYWFFKFSGIEFRIPKPFELGAVASLAERSLEFMISDEMTGKRFASVVGDLIGNQMSMNPIPQAMKPIIDLYANYDGFTKRPIESQSMQKLDKEMRFNSSTSMVARGLSTATGGALSPVQYDHLVRSYFGWLGSFVVGGADMAARAAMDEPTKPALDYFKFATQGMLKEEGTGSSRYLTQMYDQAKELETTYSTYRQLIKDGKIVDAQEYASDNKESLSKYRQAEGVKKAESKFNEQIRIIERSNIDPSEKKDRIENINKLKEQVAKRIAPGLQ